MGDRSTPKVALKRRRAGDGAAICGMSRMLPATAYCLARLLLQVRLYALMAGECVNLRLADKLFLTK
ncbi:MAG TPA: hypothetical protein VGL27_04225 [Negativicutes bacterium]